MVAAGAVGTICFLPAESDGAVDETVGEDSAEEVERVNCEDSPAGSAEEGVAEDVDKEGEDGGADNGSGPV